MNTFKSYINQVFPDSETTHFVNGRRIMPPFPEEMAVATFGMGCFWGVEKRFWGLDGVFCTAVGYAGGSTHNPTYQDVCGGETNHAEVVRIVFNSQLIDYKELIKIFWEAHNPTQGMKQGNDVGTQYRSVIFTHSEMQHQIALETRDAYQKKLALSNYPMITTEIAVAPTFYYAELYHQQYLAKNPDGYCGLKGTGICF